MGWILFGETHHNDTELMSRVRARSGRGSVLPLAEHVSLGAADGVRLRRARPRRLADGALARLPPSRRRPARDVAGELGDAHVGRGAGSTTRDDSQEQLVGRDADLRRGLAQQPPCASDVGPSRSRLVRARHHLASRSGCSSASAWPSASASWTSKDMRRGEASAQPKNSRIRHANHGMRVAQGLAHASLRARPAPPFLPSHSALPEFPCPSCYPGPMISVAKRKSSRLRAARRLPGGGRRRPERQLDRPQLARGAAPRLGHHLLPRHHRRRRPEHDLPGAGGAAQRAARHLHQRRDARAEDAGRVHPALSRDARAPRPRRTRSGASSIG